MARIAGVDIPNNKRVEIALTYIYGIGRKSANDILAKTGINPDTRAKDLTEAEVAKLRDEIESSCSVEGDLRRDVALNIKRLVEINCYRGIRHRKGLPVRGQRTKSVEHEVSIITAIQAMENMNEEKYDIVPVYITKDNKMYCGQYINDITQYKDMENLLRISSQVTLAQRDGKVALLKCKPKFLEDKVYDYIDIAFPIVHGTNVEDGTLQGYLKMFNLPYAGCDVTSSAIGMDKYACKCLLHENGIPVLDCVCFTGKDCEDGLDSIIEKTEERFEYPVIVKPVNLGSSIGIQIAKNKDELLDAVEEAFTYSSKVLIEKAITNMKEVNCSVLGDGDEAQASECEEPVKTEDILSFNDKYISGGKKTGGKLGGKFGAKTSSQGKFSMNSGVLKLPAEITPEQKEKIQELSLKTFEVLGCSGVIRIDFMIDEDDGSIYVNEVNTIPGSLSFHLWKATGVSYEELLDRVIELAMKRNREEQSRTFSFDSNILAGYSARGLKGAKGMNK